MATPNLHKGHRERVKDEFRRLGLEHFPDHKILELLLYYSIPQRDTNPIGHSLMDRFGSLTGVFDAPIELLREVDGVTEHTATLIKLASALIRAYLDDAASNVGSIRGHETAKEYVRYKFLGIQRECVYMVCLGNNGKILLCDRIAEGSPETVRISSADIVKTALRANAVRVVLAHNHPHGICNPSRKDLQTTSLLFEALHKVDIELADHIIVAPDGVYSMAEHNMFPAHIP